MNRSGSTFWFRFAAVAALYSACNLATVWLPSRPEFAATIWPGSGLALAAVFLFGRGMVPAVMLGTILINVVAHPAWWRLGIASAILPTLGPAIANGFGAWLGAEWVRRFCGGREAFQRGKGFLRFVAVSVLIVPLLSTTLGTVSWLAGGQLPAAIFGQVWTTWWLSVCMGNLIFLPLVLAWTPPDLSRLQGWTIFQAMVLLALLMFTGLYFSTYAGAGSEFPVAFLIIPLVLCIGYRLRAVGVTVALLVIAAISIVNALHGFVVFPGHNANESLGYLQFFLCIVAVAGLGFVAVLEERDFNLAQLHALNAELEAKVTARTRKLERINQELTDAVSIVAHDVRGPVSGIRTLAHHMRWSALDLTTAEGNELLGEIERTSAAAVDMMARLLDLQRANDRSGHHFPACVGDLVGEACRPYEKTAKEKGIEFRIFRPARGRLRVVDAEGIKFIASNLVSNAIKFLPAGGIVDVRVMENGEECRLAVIDNGPGIDAEELAGIFQRFTRASNRPTRGESSTGLGLFIVRKLVLAMNGTLYVESARGEGAAFVVEWPAATIRSEDAPA